MIEMPRLRELRKLHGITARQLAEELHLSESSITMYETGKREPSPETLIKIADIFGTSVDALLDHEPTKKEPVAKNHELTEQERALIELLGQVPPEKREQVLLYLEASLRLQGVL